MLKMETPERLYWRRYNVFIVTLYTYLTPFRSVSIVDFEQVNVTWEVFLRP